MGFGKRRVWKKAIFLAGIILFLLIMVLSFWFDRQQETMILSLEAQDNCELEKRSCRVMLNQHQWVELAINDQALVLMKSLTARVNLGGLEADLIEMKVTGLNMDMGSNVFQFKAQDQMYKTTFILPICSRKDMHWQAQVRIKHGDAWLEINYYFSTQAAG